jgi:ribosomal protein L24
MVSGMVVDIVGGKYKGKTGTFVKRTAERIQIIVDDKQFPVYLKTKNIQFRSQLRTKMDTNSSEIMETISQNPNSPPCAGCQATTTTMTPPKLASRTVVLSTPPTGEYEIHTRVIMMTGNSVNIIGGIHQGKVGTLIRQTAKRVLIIVEGSHTPVMLLPDHIQEQNQCMPKPYDSFVGQDLELQTVINRCFLEAKDEFHMLCGSSYYTNSAKYIRA